MFSREDGSPTGPNDGAGNGADGSFRSHAGSDPSDFLKTQSSFIGPDLVFIAQDLKIISQSSLRLDGETTGEILGTEIIVGELGKITGTIAANAITIHGEVNGTIRAPEVTLGANARVNGDIHHASLEITRGAVFHGRSFFSVEGSELVPELRPA
ncbi:MAG: polymer-forming cytoskeletal protein [Hyphomicrobiaceae bacterium]